MQTPKNQNFKDLNFSNIIQQIVLVDDIMLIPTDNCHCWELGWKPVDQADPLEQWIDLLLMYVNPKGPELLESLKLPGRGPNAPPLWT